MHMVIIVPKTFVRWFSSAGLLDTRSFYQYAYVGALFRMPVSAVVCGGVVNIARDVYNVFTVFYAYKSKYISSFARAFESRLKKHDAAFRLSQQQRI